jgi:hypothetical protein
MSLDMTVGTRGAANLAATAPAEMEEAAPASRLWLYELTVAAVAAFGAVMTSGVAVLLYLR